MLNFLPEQQAKAVRRRYHGRLAAAFAVALATGAAAYGIAATPATFAAWQAADAIESKVAALAASAENREFGETLAAARGLRADAAAASPSLAPSVSGALDLVLAKERPTIAVSSIELRRAGTSTVVATVSGVAATREDLLSFVADLDRDPAIDAALPVGDLARDRGAPFTLDADVHQQSQ